MSRPIANMKAFLLCIGSMLVGFFLFAVFRSISGSPVPKLEEQSRNILLTQEESALGVRLIESTNGWNLVHFLDYSYESCRNEEARIAKEIQEFAPKVGRIIMLWPNPSKPESAWPARLVLLAGGKSTQNGKIQHHNMMVVPSLSQKTVLSMRPPSSIINPVGTTEDAFLAELKSEKVSATLKGTDALAKRLGLIGVPAYLLVSPTGEGWIVGSLDEWKDLVQQKGLAGY